MDLEEETKQPSAYGTGDELQKRKSRKSSYGKGVAAGFAGGFLSVLTVVLVVIAIVYRMGYLHVGTNGEIYVQDAATVDTTGIGNSVASKLNALDSLMDYFYFEDVDQETIQTNIYKAFLNSYGDKYTVYYTPEEYKKLLETTTGTFYGIGALCQKQEDGSILVIDAYEDAPGYLAGLRNGDEIRAIDGQSILEMDLSTAVAMIKGDKGTTVLLEGTRDGDAFSITVTRDAVKEKTITYELSEDAVGFIKIAQFEEVTTDQFKAAIEDLTSQGMKGLIIDLRGNPGGVVSAVIDMLDYILPDGLIMYTEDKNGNRREYNGSNSAELTVPLAVLVNGNSASAAEIFAGAVQDYEKGAIIGTQTYGKGIVQAIRPLTDGSAVKMTISKYFTGKGQDIHGKGVTPDQVIEDDESTLTDEQVDAAYEYIFNQFEE